MMRFLGEQVRKQFEIELDFDKMKLAAIRVDYLNLKKEEGKKI